MLTKLLLKYSQFSGNSERLVLPNHETTDLSKILYFVNQNKESRMKNGKLINVFAGKLRKPMWINATIYEGKGILRNL